VFGLKAQRFSLNAFSQLLCAEWMIDAEAPSAVALPPRDFHAIAAHVDRLAIRSFSQKAPFASKERGIFRLNAVNSLHLNRAI
jgi:hypothetical protein